MVGRVVVPGPQFLPSPLPAPHFPFYPCNGPRHSARNGSFSSYFLCLQEHSPDSAPRNCVALVSVKRRLVSVQFSARMKLQRGVMQSLRVSVLFTLE